MHLHTLLLLVVFLLEPLFFDRCFDVAVAVQDVDAVLGQVLHFEHFVVPVVFGVVEDFSQLVLLQLFHPEQIITTTHYSILRVERD